MNNSSDAVQIAVFGTFAALIACLLFGSGSHSTTPGFRVFPAGAAEWIAYWFHTLEFVLFCCALLAHHKGARYVPFLGLEGLFNIAIGAALLLLASAVAFWRRTRSLSQAALGWLLLSLVYSIIFYPVITAVKE